MGKLLEKDLDAAINRLKEELRKEIPGFMEKGQQFLDKEITNAQFKGASGGMGVYAQRGGEEFMIRLRLLSGVVDYPTLRFVYNMVKKHSLEYIHVTTRQAIQLHNLKLEQMIDIMEQSLEHNIITKGAGGNFPRNVALSPLSGIEKGEAFDVTPYAVFVNKYFVSRINTYHLPRKFKVAFSNHGQDSANASIADLGFLAVNKDGKEFFQIFLGGSMGPNGAIAVPYDELVSPQEVLYHVEAMLSLFKAEGDYQNKAKARIRYIVQRMGKEEFLECYKAHLNHIKQTQDLSFEINGTDDKYPEISGENLASELEGAIAQKQNYLYTAVLHPQGGLLMAKDLGIILDYIENIEAVQIRLSMEEGLFIRNLTFQQAKELLELTKDIRKTTRLGCSISCIGASICQIGIQDSQGLLAKVLNYFEEKEFTEDILPSISISGCTNSCARHQVSELGFQGKKKRVGEKMEDSYALQIGGKVGETGAKLAKESGDLLERDIPEFLYQLAMNLKERKLEYSEYLEQHEEELEELVAKYRV
jgi:sulfite reductase beta subunit-like hemoprotein